MDKQTILEHAIEVAKKFGEGGNVSNADYIIEQCYNKILEIADKGGFLVK